MLKKLITITTCVLFAGSQANFAFADILPHNSVVVNKPSVTMHPTKSVPIVNIVAPNAKGLSHNKYDEFNVTPGGVVLNNSAADASYSQILQEDVDVNSNLAGIAATIILNEIMASAKTTISGPVEIAGTAADLVIANAYGISVNGGSFINANKTALITGAPNIVDGIISTFTMGKTGKIEISGNVISDNPVELISRYMKLSENASLNAGDNDIAVITGNGTYDYQTKKMTSVAATDNPADKYAVNAAAFGSMYGGSIKIIATEAGFGVKTESGSNLASSIGEILIETENGIEAAGSINSVDAVTLSALSVTNTGKVEAAGALAIKADNITNIRALTDGAYSNTAAVLKGNTVSITGKTNEYAQSINNYASTIESAGKMALKADNIENCALTNANTSNYIRTVLTNEKYELNKEYLYSYTAVTGTFGIIGSANIISNGDLEIYAQNLNNLSSNINAANNVFFNVNNLNNGDYGKPLSLEKTYRTYYLTTPPFGTPSLTYRTRKEYESIMLYANAPSSITGNNITISGLSVTNTGKIEATGAFAIMADNVTNTRSATYGIYSANAASIKGGTVSITGKTNEYAQNINNYASTMESAGNMALKANNIENSALPDSAEEYTLKRIYTGNPAVANDTVLYSYTYIVGNLNLLGTSSILSGGNLEVCSGNLNNISSTVNAAGDIFLNTDNLNNAYYSKILTTEKTYRKYNPAAIGFFEWGSWGGSKAPTIKEEYTLYEDALYYANIASSITGKNITINASDGVSQTSNFTNIASTIKADEKLSINAVNIRNEGVSVNSNRGIKTSQIYTGLTSPLFEYAVQWYETAQVTHEAQAAVLSGTETEINAYDIYNLSSQISGSDKLSITANNLTNTSIMFQDTLMTYFHLFGKHKGQTNWGGNFDDPAHRYYTMYAPYTFVSKTIGEISGGEVDIALSGLLTQEQNSGALQRAKAADGTYLYSNINGSNVNISAGSILNYGALTSDNLLKVTTTGDFKNYDAKIISNDLDLYAGNDFTAETMPFIHEFPWNGTFLYEKSYTNPYGLIMSTNDMSIKTGNNLTLIRTDVLARGDGSILAGNTLSLLALQPHLKWKTRIHEIGSDNFSNKPLDKDLGTIRIFGDAEIDSAVNSVTFEGYNIIVSKNLRITAAQDVTIKSVKALEESGFYSKMDKGWQGSEEEMTRKVTITNIGSFVQVGGKLDILAGGNINILASTLESLSDVINLTAGMDVNVLAGENYESAERIKITKGTFGLSMSEGLTLTDQKDSYFNEKTTLAASSIKGGKGVTITAQGNKANADGTASGNINIVGSNIESGADLTLNAKNNINVLAGYEMAMSAETHEKTKIGIGAAALGMISPVMGIAAVANGNGDFMTYNYEKSESQIYETAAKGSLLKSGGTMSLTAGNDISFAGSDAVGAGDVKLEAARNVNILSAEQLKTVYSESQSVSAGMGFINGIDFSQLDRGRISVELGKGELVSDKYQEYTATNQGSAITSGGALTVKAGKDVNLQGASLDGDTVAIAAENINLLTAQNTSKTESSHKQADLTLKAGITNSYFDAYYAGDALVKAGEQQAAAESELSRIQALYDEGKATQEAVDDAKANVELSRVNLLAATTNAIATAAGAVNSGLTFGFNASLMADANVNEQTHKETTINTIGNLITARGDISLNAKNNITQVGSSVISESGNVTYAAGDKVSILAGRNSNATKDTNDNYNANYTIGTAGFSAGIGYSQAGNSTSDVWYNNSLIKADNGKVSIKTGLNDASTGNMEFKGANILAKDVDIDVKGNLIAESVQDTHRQDGKQTGLNAGIAGGSGVDLSNGLGLGKVLSATGAGSGVNSATFGANYGQSKEDGAWVNVQTGIIGSNSVNINVGEKLTNTGAVIANADYGTDENGKLIYSNDKGNLIINAKEIEVKDVSDHFYSESYNYGANFSFGKFDGNSNFIPALPLNTKNLNMTFYNQGSKKEQLNRATIGQGDIYVNGQLQTQEQLTGVNRDIGKSQEITRDVITNDLNAELAIDVRFWVSLYDFLAGNTEVEGYDENGNEVRKRKQISVVDDANAIIDTIDKISEALRSKTQKDLAAKMEKITLSDDAESDEKAKKLISNSQEVQELEQATENLSTVEKYIKEHKIDAQTAETLRRAAVDGDVYFFIDDSGVLKARYFATTYNENEQVMLLSLGIENALSASFLNAVPKEGNAEEIYASKILAAQNAITEILDTFTGYELTKRLASFSTDTDSALPVAQIGLDLIGIAPVIGMPADALSLKISEYYGDETGMGLSLLAMDPQFVGMAAGVAKVGKGVAKSTKSISKLINVLTKDGGSISKAANKLVKSDAQILAKSAKNISYEAKGYTYKMDNLERITLAGGELRLEQGIRNPYAQLSAGGVDRLATDHGFHLIGTRFGASGEFLNLVAGNSNVNLSAYKKLENVWANALKEGKKVIVEVAPIYKGNSIRPSRFEIKYSIDGVQDIKILNNK